GVHGLGEAADLVDLDQDRVGDILVDAALQALDVGHEEIVANQLHARAQLAGEFGPARPVVLSQPVLDRDDRVLRDPAVPEADHLVGIETAALGREAVHALLEVLGRGWVEGDADLAAWDVTGLLDSLQQYLDGLVVALQVGGEAALVADVGVVAARAKHL